MGEEERAGARVVELSAIVALNSLDGSAELSMCIGKKVRQGQKGVRLWFQGKRPQKMRAISEND
jgi:hypothetical protein